MRFKNWHGGIVAVLMLLWIVNIAVHSNKNELTSADWHQWRGPNRDGTSQETGFLKNWSHVGPRELWRIPLGSGFSGVSVSDGRVYTMYAKGDDEIVVCLDAQSGHEIWRYLDDYLFEYHQGGDGPRSTPTVDDSVVYAFSAYGRLVALDALTGKLLWDNDFTETFSSEVPQYGFAASPIVEANLILSETGGVDGRAIVAFDKGNGDIVWRSDDSVSGYSSPITVTILERRQTIFFMADGLVSISPMDGAIQWTYGWKTPFNVNAATPVFIPPDKIFISSGYDVGAAVIQIGETGGKLMASEVWTSRVMKNHFSSSVFHYGYLYGFDNAILKCIDATTGEEQWSARGFGKGSLICADGHLIILGERGNLALVKAIHTEFKRVAETQVFTGRCWTLPTLSDGKLYLRNNQELICFDLSDTS